MCSWFSSIPFTTRDFSNCSMLAAGGQVVKPALARLDRRVLIKQLASRVHPFGYQSQIHGQTFRIPHGSREHVDDDLKLHLKTLIWKSSVSLHGRDAFCNLEWPPHEKKSSAPPPPPNFSFSSFPFDCCEGCRIMLTSCRKAKLVKYPLLQCKLHQVTSEAVITSTAVCLCSEINWPEKPTTLCKLRGSQSLQSR